MDPITFNGETFGDKLVVTTQVHISVWQRIKNLFCPVMEFRHEVYTENVIGRHHTVAFVRSLTYSRMVKKILFKKKKTGLVAPK